MVSLLKVLGVWSENYCQTLSKDKAIRRLLTIVAVVWLITAPAADLMRETEAEYLNQCAHSLR